GLDRPDEPQPRLFAAARPSPRRAGPVRLAVVGIRRNEGSPASRLKTLAYLDNVLARRAARLAGADEAVMLNNRGEVACAAAANLFWFDAGILLTPALDCGVLDGITRRAVIEAAGTLGLDVREVRATVADLARGSGVFLTNSLIGQRPAASFDGAPIAPHPAFAALIRVVARNG
nr:aminotransferase class IV [Caulobacteraceae bacterium]